MPLYWPEWSRQRQFPIANAAPTSERHEHGEIGLMLHPHRYHDAHAN